MNETKDKALIWTTTQICRDKALIFFLLKVFYPCKVSEGSPIFQRTLNPKKRSKHLYLATKSGHINILSKSIISANKYVIVRFISRTTHLSIYYGTLHLWSIRHSWSDTTYQVVASPLALILVPYLIIKEPGFPKKEANHSITHFSNSIQVRLHWPNPTSYAQFRWLLATL
jgi:hypothetical protein